MRQALERMKYHCYAAIPIIDDSGKYVGTLTKDDLLLKMKKTPGLTIMNTEKILLKEIKMHTQNTPVFVNTQIEDLISRSNKQYFVPVIDDSGIFIGIVRWSEIFRYCTDYLNTPINY
jgi:CBS-domain-containing membrane protein